MHLHLLARLAGAVRTGAAAAPVVAAAARTLPCAAVQHLMMHAALCIPRMQQRRAFSILVSAGATSVELPRHKIHAIFSRSSGAVRLSQTGGGLDRAIQYCWGARRQRYCRILARGASVGARATGCERRTCTNAEEDVHGRAASRGEGVQRRRCTRERQQRAVE